MQGISILDFIDIIAEWHRPKLRFMMLGLICIAVLSFGKQVTVPCVQLICVIVTVFVGEATDVKISETVDIEIDFNRITSAADKVISKKLLDSEFTLEVQNVSNGDEEVQMKYYYRFIPATFTQSELEDFVKDINKITKSSNPNTVIDDFIKIGAVTSTFMNHGVDPTQTRSKRGCSWYWIGVRCTWGRWTVSGGYNRGLYVSVRYRW